MSTYEDKIPTIELLGPPLPTLTGPEREFFAELADVLDAMPVRRLGADDYEDGECRCVMGEFSASRNVNPDGHALEDLAAMLRVPVDAACSVVKVNDDGRPREEVATRTKLGVCPTSLRHHVLTAPPSPSAWSPVGARAWARLESPSRS
jgi:hypothetical protein